jgi:hypothetical protein
MEHKEGIQRMHNTKTRATTQNRRFFVGEGRRLARGVNSQPFYNSLDDSIKNKILLHNDTFLDTT